jgi:hypothetical protein
VESEKYFVIAGARPRLEKVETKGVRAVKAATFAIESREKRLVAIIQKINPTAPSDKLKKAIIKAFKSRASDRNF